MRLICAIIAKHADLGKDNGVSMMGGCITAIRAPAIPFGANLAIVVRLHLEPEECDRDHGFKVARIIGPDGVAVAGSEGPVAPFNSKIEPDARFGSFTGIMQLELAFLAAGVYRFVFSVDDVDIGELELDVLRPQVQSGVVQ